jgi:hypothetical protein
MAVRHHHRAREKIERYTPGNRLDTRTPLHFSHAHKGLGTVQCVFAKKTAGFESCSFSP